MGPPRSPSLPSAQQGRWKTASGGPGGNRTLISWVQATDPPVERRAHPGEDNGTRTRTPALTTRRLSLRLCPPQDGPRAGKVVGSRGLEPRSARSERAASANCATSRRWWSLRVDSAPRRAAQRRGRAGAITRSGDRPTTTSRVENPACCVDTTKGELELIPGIEPGRRPYQGRRLPLHQISVGANGGIRTRTSRLGRPAGNRYPTFALVRSQVSTVDTQTEHGPVAFTGPGTPVSCQRPHSCELIWRQRQDSNPDPRGLEARMLPLHHAVVVASHLDRSRDKTSP